TAENGDFLVHLDEASRGRLVRLHVEKSGYDAFERDIIASDETTVVVKLQLHIVPPPARKQPQTVRNQPALSPVVASFLRRLKSGTPAEKRDAATALGDMGAEAGVPPVVDALNEVLIDPDESVNVAAATALAKIGSKSEPVITSLIIALKEPGKANLRLAAVNALMILGNSNPTLLSA